MTVPASSPAHRNLELYAIAVEMVRAGLSEEFADAAVRTAMEFEGVHDLLALWRDEPEAHERDAIVADIADLIEDCQQQSMVEKPMIRLNDLDAIARQVREFKDSLRLIVDKEGGVQELSRRTGMPQPSISRFFATTSMPRRATLLKFAQALGLSEVEIATPWQR